MKNRDAPLVGVMIWLAARLVIEQDASFLAATDAARAADTHEMAAVHNAEAARIMADFIESALVESCAKHGLKLLPREVPDEIAKAGPMVYQAVWDRMPNALWGGHGS